MMKQIAKTFKIFSAAALVAFFSIGTVFAQDTEISDEKLEAYVMVMDSVDALRAQLSEDISTMIKEHELMEGGKIYSNIKSANGDSLQLVEQGITPEQMAAFNEIENTMAERTSELNTAFSDMVKEHVGVSEYKAIKQGLRNDEDLKARYEAMMAEREGSDATTTEGGEETSAGESAADETLSQQ